MTRRIAVYCGANRGLPPAYAHAARDLGHSIASRGWGLVYGGGRVGLMGVLADAALAAGGHVIGVLPQALMTRELAHTGVSDLRVVDGMHARKALMADLADAFITLPGGFGTLDETFEILTWQQLHLHSKPFGLLNPEGFFDPLLEFLGRGVRDGLLRQEHLDEILVERSAAVLLDRVSMHQPARTRKWLPETP